MSYGDLENRLRNGGVVLLDGGTGTELERRGVSMDAEAWCGTAALKNGAVLESIHRDYIAAGADIITANTYASSRLLLEPAGLGDQFEEINRAAIGAAHRARKSSAKAGILVAGSLSHQISYASGLARTGRDPTLASSALGEAFGELAMLLRDEGCDLILLEMMYYPERMAAAFTADLATGLPVWAGLSVRHDENGEMLGHDAVREIPYSEMLAVLQGFDVAAAGTMHSPAHVTGEAIELLKSVHDGPLLAYPDSGYFAAPQ